MRSINRRQFVYGTGAVLGSTMFGCGRPDGPTAGADTTVFVNGTVLPVDAAFSGHEALAISGNRILAVGARDEVLAAAGRGAKTVDLAGRVVLPGFIEPHMHFALMAGLGFIEDVGPFRFPTFDDALDALRRIAAAAGPDEWVMGRQFDPILLDSPRDLTTRDLDPITPDRPAFVLNASGHIAYVNSKTLELVGITRDSEDPPGGEYGRYEDGTPNGVMYGQAAYMGILFLNEKITERMQSGFVTAGREVGDEAAALLAKHERVVVEVAGHTDSTGPEAYNQGLSERRAKSVQDYLVSKGIRASRLTAKGYGESMPVASNDTEKGRAENRRVELIVLDR